MKSRKVLLAVTVVATGMIFCKLLGMPSSEAPVVASRRSNPELKTILPSWQGTPVDKNGRGCGTTPSFIISRS